MLSQKRFSKPLPIVSHQHIDSKRTRVTMKDIKQKLSYLIKIIILIIFLFNLDTAGINSVYAMDAPSLISPTSGLTTTIVNHPPLGIPEFVWSSVEGATSYRIQVSNDIGFTSCIVNQTTPNTSYTPISASVFSDTTWYWRVRVDGPTVSEYSEIRSFNKEWATTDNKPTLTSPDDAATIDFYEYPNFSWVSIPGAVRYKFQISTDSVNWTSPSYNTLTIATTHQPAIKLANGTYYWRVVPVDAGNHDGTPSDVRTIYFNYDSVPQLIEPADSSNPVFTPTFRWTAVEGVQYYRLQYSTDQTFNTSVTTVDTRNTTYTPTDTLPNDVNYYWRVRTHSNYSISDWSSVYSFVKKWYIKPTLLTPTNNYQHQRFPVFSWTPVPGANYYYVEISLYPGFGSLCSDSGTTSNTYFTVARCVGGTYYWRVTPYDGGNRKGVESETFSYVSYADELAPYQVYPLYYFEPNNYTGYSDIEVHPFEDRTVSLPVFMWHKVYSTSGEVYPEAYRLQVSQDPTFDPMNIEWEIDTENTVATPDSSHPFTPEIGALDEKFYYWRVRPLIGGSEAGHWSQIWTTHFTSTLALTPTTGSAPELIRPTTGFEYVEATPLLEWFPLDSASAYDIEISKNESFTEIVDTATVSYPAYAPTQSLAQRNLGDVDFGIFYWRVRATSGDWSETRRFQIAAQSQWQLSRTVGDSSNQLQIGSDSVADVAVDYDLSDLFASQSSNYWFLGFHVPTTPTINITYTLYLDTDHQSNSGATFDAKGFSISTIDSYRPEYAIYVLQESGVYSADKVYIYKWEESVWGTVQILSNIGGQISHADGYVELQIPNTGMGYQTTTGGSYAVSLLSLPSSSGSAPQDSVPSDPNIPGSGSISRFSNTSERMNLISPPNDASVDPTTFSSVLPFFWDYPILSPWTGAALEVHLDEAFTSKVAEYIVTSSATYFVPPSRAHTNDLTGDNTYYWRVRPKYLISSSIYGVWTQGWRFERKGFVPTNLNESVTFATPTFNWDMVEGANYYDLQVDNDDSFGSTAVNISTRQNSYTPTGTLPNATYYWRVRVHRYGNVVNEWSDVQSFTLSLPTPENLTHIPPNVVDRAPTFHWNPILEYQDIYPVLSAYRYRVQISKDQTFTTIFDSIDTEQTYWTPTKGYDDGLYYWRVAMIDGSGYFGSYSPYETFTKQYPISTLVSPLNGAGVSSTPTFIWTAVNNAYKYRLEISQDVNFSPLYDSIETNNTRYTPIKNYAIGKTYYWRVAMVDADGKFGPYNDAMIILDPCPYRAFLPASIR